MRLTAPRPRDLQIGVFVFCLALAWQHRFLQDDAFISFRYARNLATGHGLVWNPGERVEGYTNFLWTLLLAVPAALGLDQPQAAFAIGLACFAGTLWTVFRLARVLGCTPVWAALVVLMLGTNFTFSSYATSGLETQLQALTIAANLLVLFRIARGEIAGRRVMIGTSLLLAAACLTRLDSVLLLAPVGLYAVSRMALRHESRAVALAWLLLPGAAIGVAWFAWKHAYYGDVLPNTFVAKLPDASAAYGLRFVAAFFLSYWLWPFALLALGGTRTLWRRRRIEPPLLLITCALWVAYIVVAGGDFMEFRMFVPILPLMMVLVAVLITAVVPWRALQLVLVAGVIASGAVAHPRYFGKTFFYKDLRIEATWRLHASLYAPDANWVGIGKALKRELTDLPGTVIATTAAGAIPYYSELTAVDMLGLTDPWVARFGIRVSHNPGHFRIARVGYLMGRHVNLVIGPPWTIPREEIREVFDRRVLRRFGLILPEREVLPANSSVIRIPIDDAYDMLAVVLIPPDGWTELVQRKGWTTYPIDSR